MRKSKNYVLRMVSGIPLLICSTVPNGECWMYELNEVGKLVWEICDQYGSIDELVCSMDDFFISPLTESQKITIREYCEVLERIGIINDER